jgi:hypothetical protein
MIRNSAFNFLFLAFLLTMPLRTTFAMEANIDEEKLQWKIDGDFTKFNSCADLNRQLRFQALSENNFITNISVCGYENNDINIFIYTSSTKNDIFRNISNEVKAYANSTNSFGFRSSNNNLDKFLNAFYRRDLIPDFIIDRIIKDIGIEDFRMDSNRFIQLINQKINENSTDDDFMRIVNEELQKIKDPVRAQTIVWDLIRDLKDSANFDKNVVISLCEKINNQDLPFYSEVKIMQANMTHDSAKITDVVDRYHQPITLLLSAKDGCAKEQLNVLVKAFYNNDIPGGDAPHELEDLSPSPESMFRLLNLLRLQKLELDRLRK